MKHLTFLALFFSCALFAQIRDYCWVKTHSWRSNCHIATEDFRLFGDKWRVSYKTKGRGPLRILLKDEGDLYKSLVNVKDQPSGRTSPDKPDGLLRLSIYGPSTGWAVEIEEYMDTLQEWRFRQWKETQPQPGKFAVWAGDASDEIVFEAPSAKWCLTSQALSGGLLQVCLTDEQGKLLYENYAVSSHEPVTGWIHKSGPVHLKVMASDVKWRIEASSDDIQE